MMQRPVNTVPLAGPVQAYQTYRIAAPVATHFRPATCAEVSCPAYLHGWRLRVEELAPADLHLAKTAGRKYTVQRITEGETWLVYEAGQPCFRAGTHRLPLGKPEHFLVQGVDRWLRQSVLRRHVKPEDWVEDCAENQSRIADAQRRG